MKTTNNYGLKKPEQNDYVNIEDLNYNADAIDQAMHKNKTERANLSLSNLNTPQQALANLGAGVRPTLIDNPGLDINQIGGLFYDTSNVSGYGVDRWWSYFARYDVKTKNFISSSENYGAAMRQAISDPVRLAGKTVTITAWILGGTGSVGLLKSTGINSDLSSLGNIQINGPGLYTKEYVLPEDIGSDSYPYLIFAISTPIGGSLQFESSIPFKMEIGSGQTLAYQDSYGVWKMLPQPDTDFASQLLKCQRYLWASKVSSNGYSVFGWAVANTDSIAYLLVDLPVSARDVLPVILNDVSKNVIIRSTQWLPGVVTSMSVDSTSLGGSKVLIKMTGTFTPGETYLVYTNNRSPLIFSWEL